MFAKLSKLRKLVLVLQLAVLLTSCGLVGIQGQSIETPSLNAKATGDLRLTLNVRGSYPPAEYPRFSGVLVYIGDNNVVNDIEKRILYVSDQNFLPSVNAAASANFNVNIVLGDTFAYRYTSLANDEDYSAANISNQKDKLLIKRFSPLETYYFRVKIVTEDFSSSSSLTVPIKIPLIIALNDLNLSASPSLASLPEITSANLRAGFGNLQLSSGNIAFIDNDSAPLKINSLANGARASIFDDDIVVNSQGNLVNSGYEIFSFYPLVDNWNYSFILSGDEDNRDNLARNLRMHVSSKTASSLDFTLAYYQNFVTDIDAKEALN